MCRSCFSAPLQPKHIDHAQGKQDENGLINACGNIFGTVYHKQDFYCRQACYDAHSRDKQTEMMMCFHLAMDGVMFADEEHEHIDAIQQEFCDQKETRSTEHQSKQITCAGKEHLQRHDDHGEPYR